MRVPLRISICGGGTDYPIYADKYGGSVLSTTIDKYVYITCRPLPPFFEHKSRIVWSEIELVKSVPEIHHPAVRECLRFCGAKQGLEIHYDGDLPARSGLGSSSSFTVGMLHALYALQDKMVTKKKLAQDAIYVEQERIGATVGYQDQVAAAFGGLNRIDFHPGGGFDVQPVILSHKISVALQSHLMLFYTGEARDASEIAQEQVRLTPSKEAELAAMKEMVDRAIGHLAQGNVAAIGDLLHDSWMLKKNLSPKIATSTADLIYGSALAAGATGGKIAGAGGGGFFLLFVPPEKQEAVRSALTGFLEVPFAFESEGSKIIYYSHDGDLGVGRVGQTGDWVTACGSGMN